MKLQTLISKEQKKNITNFLSVNFNSNVLFYINSTRNVLYEIFLEASHDSCLPNKLLFSERKKKKKKKIKW